MMIFQAHVEGATWLTLVVRAANEHRALELARNAALQYVDESDVVVEWLDENGAEGVLIEDTA